MLKNVLAKAAAAIGDIISDPIGFLGNLIGAVKGGINKFFANIGAHLKKGLMGWLFGQLGDAGIEIPDTFDIKGIIKLLASIFGLTWANIKNRIVKQIGEKAMAAIEAGVDIFQKIASGGISAVWEMLMEKLGDIRKMIMDQIEDFVLTKIITAGITWLISLLNPAAAFIKACKLIYDVVMFFVNNAERIIKFVNTVIDGIVDIAKGNVSAVVDRIEDALSQMVPILIGFIASVLGIGGIGEKIKSIVQALQKPVNKALDFVIKTGLKLAGPDHPGAQGNRREGQGEDRLRQGIREGQGRRRQGVREGEGRRGQVPPPPWQRQGRSRFGAADGHPRHPHHRTVQHERRRAHALRRLVRDKLKIEMASERRELFEFLLQQAGEEADAMPKGSAAKLELKMALGQVKPVLNEAERLFKGGKEGKIKVTAAHEREIHQLVVKAAGLLGDIGRKFMLKSLKYVGHASEWVTIDNELKTPYRGKLFRPTVYGGWNKANGTGGSFRRAEFARLAAMIPPNSEHFGKPKMFLCPECGQIRRDEKESRYDFTIDHEPSVISNWLAPGPGHDNSFDERNAFFNGNGSTLTGMCRACNSGLGGGNEAPNDYAVGHKFRGKGEGSA